MELDADIELTVARRTVSRKRVGEGADIRQLKPFRDGGLAELRMWYFHSAEPLIRYVSLFGN